MKKIIALMIVVVSLTLTGCREGNVEDKSGDMSEFVIVESTYNWDIVYHKKTKVMYAVSQGKYNGGNFTLLVNADGTPLIYEGE